MSDIAITVEKLSKRYRIGQSTNGDKTLRDTLAGLATAPFRRKMSAPSHIQKSISNSTSASLRSAEIWALREVSFEVKHGEVVGVIGRNGAGKSTLLKILSRITEPTEGYAEIDGRVGSLLEVGTGFHPELTGRENIYLNGAILGMKKAEIGRKFDEIVAFAEVEKFIDTPMKHYSSGMYVRLAFAVAAHMESEILLVDEVLAVGDAAFQKKGLGKMGDVAKEGRTVLFVSHNMQAILRLCSRSILIQEGKLFLEGRSEQVVGQYLSEAQQATTHRVGKELSRAPGDDYVRLTKVRVSDESGEVRPKYDIRKPIWIDIEFWNEGKLKCLAPGIHLYNEEGLCLFMSYDHNSPDWQSRLYGPGAYRAICEIPGNFLGEGKFFVNVAINVEKNQSVCLVFMPQAVGFEVFDPFEGDSVRGPNSNTWGGVVRPMLTWSTTPTNNEA